VGTGDEHSVGVNRALARCRVQASEAALPGRDGGAGAPRLRGRNGVAFAGLAFLGVRLPLVLGPGVSLGVRYLAGFGVDPEIFRDLIDRAVELALHHRAEEGTHDARCVSGDIRTHN
jgi:hypothetical protein